MLVGDGEVDHGLVPRRQHRGEAGRGGAGQRHGRLARGKVDHTHVAPGDTLADAGAERLGAGLLGSEALGVGRPPAPTLPSARRRSTSVKQRCTKRSPKRSSDCSIRSMLQRSVPMPRIIAGCSAPASIAARIVPMAAGSPTEDRLADQKMPYVQLDHLRQRGDRAGRGIVQPVAGVTLDPLAARPRRRRAAAARTRARRVRARRG